MPGGTLSRLDLKSLQPILMSRKSTTAQKNFNKVHIMHSIHSAKDFSHFHEVYLKYHKMKNGGKRRKMAHFFKKNAWKNHIG